MPESLPADVADQIGLAASRAFALLWRAECAKIEEQVTDAEARWEIMVRALERVAKGE